MTKFHFHRVWTFRCLVTASLAIGASILVSGPAGAMSLERAIELSAHHWACTTKAAYSQHRRRLSSGRFSTEYVGGKPVLYDYISRKFVASPDCFPLTDKIVRVVERAMFAGQWCVTSKRHSPCLWIDKSKFRRFYSGSVDDTVFRRHPIRVLTPRRTRPTSSHRP